jgi:hypothetical protein
MELRVARLPRPKFVLAAEAELAPVPPLAILKTVPLQLELFIELNPASEPNPSIVQTVDISN